MKILAKDFTWVYEKIDTPKIDTFYEILVEI